MSVVIPTYNRARLLPRAIDAVLAQTFADWELLVVDDGSTDDTRAVLSAVADPRLCVVHLDVNRGIGGARHEGVARARGDLVAFLDSDDRWKPEKLARFVSAFARHPGMDLAFSDWEDINYIQGVRETGLRESAPALSLTRTVPLDENWSLIESGVPGALMRMNFTGTASTVVLRRSVFERAGNFHPDLRGSEDLEFLFRAAVSGARFGYTREVLVERHKGETSLTAQKRAFARRRLLALDSCEETLRRENALSLFHHLRGARSRTYCDIVEAAALEGRRGEAVQAFVQSCSEGPSLDAVRYLGLALLGPKGSDLLRRLTGRSRSTGSPGAQDGTLRPPEDAGGGPPK